MTCETCLKTIKYVPEYQPSSATLTLGDPFYKTSGDAENISVRRTGLDIGTIALIAIPVGIVAIWLLTKKEKG